MDGLTHIQVVVQGNAGAVGLMGLDTQGRGARCRDRPGDAGGEREVMCLECA